MVKQQIGRLQALRFFAAGAVMVAHCQHEIAAGAIKASQLRPFTLFDLGIGVDIFFFVSGFVMWYMTSNEFGVAGASPRFLLRRIVRVVPLYYGATTLLILTAVLARNHVNTAIVGPAQVIASYLFVPYANPSGGVSPILKLGWTLNYEMFFYLIFAVGLLFQRSVGVALIFGTFLSLVLLAGLLPGRWLLLSFWGHSIILEFLGGILIGMIFLRGVAIRLWTAIAMVAAGLALAVFFSVGGYLPVLPRAVFQGVPAAFIFAGVMLYRPITRPPRSARWIEIAGGASYALYLSHPFTLRAITLAWGRVGLNNAWLFIAVSTLSAGLVALAVNFWIEKPLTNWIGRLAARRSRHLAREPRMTVQPDAGR